MICVIKIISNQKEKETSLKQKGRKYSGLFVFINAMLHIYFKMKNASTPISYKKMRVL